LHVKLIAAPYRSISLAEMPFATPPMGWNSFDCFGSTVTEDEILENATILATRLKPFGWNHIVVDYCWSHPSPPSCTNPNQLSENQPYLAMDPDFRLLPAPERFPSSAGGKGFRPLADKIHGLGLKFGIHIMRGFPRQAFYPGYPAETLRHRPLDIADPADGCSWLNHMAGIKVPSRAGQDYYDSLFRLYASWGVDFVKADDLSLPYRPAEIEAIDRARRACGRPMTLSLSPGPCPVERHAHVREHADMWRMCADFWDEWEKLKQMFELCRSWAPYRCAGHWPDADMLPLGRLSKRGPVGPEHESFFTKDEQVTLLTLWVIFRSPLFIGGNLPEMREETLALLTNPEILAAHRDSVGGLPLRQDANQAVWISERPGDGVFAALFNLSDTAARVEVSWDDLGLDQSPRALRNLWTRTDLPIDADGVFMVLPPHGSALLSASPSAVRLEQAEASSDLRPTTASSILR
jgi:alpha-galactosidase